MIIINKETAQMRIFLDFTNLLGDAVVWSRVWLFLDLSLLYRRRENEWGSGMTKLQTGRGKRPEQ